MKTKRHVNISGIIVSNIEVFVHLYHRISYIHSTKVKQTNLYDICLYNIIPYSIFISGSINITYISYASKNRQVTLLWFASIIHGVG